MNNCTLLTMAQGNIRALHRTIENFKQKGVINEVIFGDMLIFDDDREKLYELQKEYNAEEKFMRIVPMDFNFTFKFGFAATLNRLASFATNDMVLYMNVSEVIDRNLDLSLISPQYNSYLFNHSTESHLWTRCYNRNHLYWSGVIHEIVVPFSGYEYRTCPQPLFMMADTEKDMDDPFKAKVFNDVKELVYFNQYLKLVENVEICGATNSGWVQFAQQDYDSFRERLRAKGMRYWAFKNGDLQAYLHDVYTNAEFEFEHQESSQMINLQGMRRDKL